MRKPKDDTKRQYNEEILKSEDEEQTRRGGLVPMLLKIA